MNAEQLSKVGSDLVRRCGTRDPFQIANALGINVMDDCENLGSLKGMANRTRPNQILFFVSDDEKRIIKAKMAQLGTRNMGAYLRKMAIDGYIIKVDYTQQKKLAAAVSRVASNINQICRRINSTGHFYADDVAELKERQGEIWQLLKSSQSEEL